MYNLMNWSKFIYINFWHSSNNEICKRHLLLIHLILPPFWSFFIFFNFIFLAFCRYYRDQSYPPDAGKWSCLHDYLFIYTKRVTFVYVKPIYRRWFSRGSKCKSRVEFCIYVNIFSILRYTYGIFIVKKMVKALMKLCSFYCLYLICQLLVNANKSSLPFLKNSIPEPRSMKLDETGE